jgi:hypothetical protein
VAARDTTPFARLVNQRKERLDIPVVERVDRRPQLVDHELIVERRDAVGDAFLASICQDSRFSGIG